MCARRLLVTLLAAIAAAVVLFGLIQLVPFGRDHINPPTVQEPAWDSPHTRELAARACFDCHSNETVWPWYASIAPVSWLVQRDVNEGREEMNFSDWTGGHDHAAHAADHLDDIEEVLREGEMPPRIYLLMHPEARLTAQEREDLIRGLQATLQAPSTD